MRRTAAVPGTASTAGRYGLRLGKLCPNHEALDAISVQSLGFEFRFRAS